nr:hypothetical protein [Tanacetum cinerariifolium]
MEKVQKRKGEVQGEQDSNLAPQPPSTLITHSPTISALGTFLSQGAFNIACLKCNYGAGYSFTYDPIPKSFNKVQSISNPPPQSHFKIYLCQLCESNSHYGYECSQRVPLVYEPELCYNQSSGNNAYPHDSPAIAITLDLPTVEPEDSLRMGDEHLDTILKMETDEFIKSSVENLVPNPRNLFEPLFDEEIISMKIDPHYFNAESDLIESMLNHDSSIISSSLKIDSLLDEFAGELILLKSIPPGIDETDCDPEEEIRLIEILLYDNSSPRPPKEFISKNSDAAIESFSLSPIPVEDSDSFMEEINLSFILNDSMPPGIENDDYDSKVEMLILEELLSNDSLSLPENESFHFDTSSSPRPPAKPPDDDDEIKPNSEILTIEVVGDISEHEVPMPRLLPTQPTLTSNQEKSPHLLSHQGLKAFQLSFECSMMIYKGNSHVLDVPFLHFYPPWPA